MGMADIFLSYNREDLVTARRFAEGLEAEGFSVWWDVALRSGEHYDKVTERALKDAKAVVVLWSKRSVECAGFGPKPPRPTARGRCCRR